MQYFEIKNKDLLLEQYANDFPILYNLIENLSNDDFNFIPEINDAWSIKEHIAHLVDTEINGYIRFKKSILNPGTSLDLGIGDIEKSNKILNYSSENIHDLLDLLKLIRKNISEHAYRIKNENFDNYFIEHTNHPILSKCTLGFVLSFHSQHFNKHIDFIKRNIEYLHKSNSKKNSN